MRDTGWFKSTISTSGSDNRVEVRFTGDVTQERDSTNPAAVLSVDVAALVAVTKADRLDR